MRDDTSSKARLQKPLISLKTLVICIPMASVITLSLLLLFLSPLPATLSKPPPINHLPHPKIGVPKPPKPPYGSTQQNPNDVSPLIQSACNSTQYPTTCETSLMKTTFPTPNPLAIDIVLASMDLSLESLKTAQSMSKTILDSSSGNINQSSAAKNCLEFLNYSSMRLSSSRNQETVKTHIKDVKAYLSGSLLYQYDCWSALKYVNTTSLVNSTMAYLNSLMELTSNSLSMVYALDFYGADTTTWKPPKTERDGSWGSFGGGNSAFHGKKGGFGGGKKGGLRDGDGGFWDEKVVLEGMKVDATVCKDGASGCLTRVQDAVDGAPDYGKGKYVIYIKEGVYGEVVRVGVSKRNLVFVGDGIGKTVITGSMNAQQPGVSTYNTATVGINGDGFMARDITFENTAGPNSHQAVALRSDSDLSIFLNCEFLGNQDTLYAHSMRQFYKSCRIEGNVDFIFGNSATFFQDCIILVRPRQLKPESGETNAVTAQGRTDPAQITGFVFENCLVNGTQEYMGYYYKKPKAHKTYLGRPWKQYSRTIFVRCYMDVLITPEGWLPWSGDFALSTLYYGEYGNSGPGANLSGRVPWSSQIPLERLSLYSIESFIQGDRWITGG
ncbi:hypothetical protein AMTRI_Chr11g100730 [Amborella trichopoda]